MEAAGSFLFGINGKAEWRGDGGCEIGEGVDCERPEVGEDEEGDGCG
jgi:hypothetical protein